MGTWKMEGMKEEMMTDLFHLLIYIHTYIHTYILTYIHTYILIYIHTYLYTQRYLLYINHSLSSLLSILFVCSLMYSIWIVIVLVVDLYLWPTAYTC